MKDDAYGENIIQGLGEEWNDWTIASKEALIKKETPKLRGYNSDVRENISLKFNFFYTYFKSKVVLPAR